MSHISTQIAVGPDTRYPILGTTEAGDVAWPFLDIRGDGLGTLMLAATPGPGAVAAAERLRDAAQRLLDATAARATAEQDAAEATYADNLAVSA